jgi:signal transduction histidine kinase/DNA-binding response OmpR family regulator
MLTFATNTKISFFLLFSFFIANACFGQALVISENTKLPHNLSSEVRLFEDATAKLSFEEVKKQSFINNKANRILLPFSNQATWLKIDLKNDASADTVFYFFIDNNLIRKTTLYTENQAGSIIFEPFKVKEASKFKYPNFQIKLKQGESDSFYFKILSQRGIYFNLKLYDSISFEKLKDGNKTTFGFLSGLTLMVLFIVFAVGFLIIKDHNSRAYAIYTFFRATGFWASFNVLGSLISADSMVSEKIAFFFMSFNPMLSAFLALYILPFDKLAKWVKNANYGFIIFNLLLVIYLWGWYGTIPLKSLVFLTILSHLFFYSFYIYTLVKRTNTYPFYAIPLLLGSSANLVLNLRVSGIINFDYITELTGLMAILEMAVYVFYLSRIFRESVKNQAEKLRNLGFEAEKATKLEELDKLKTRFFTNISHEFRTPLTLLVGPIDDLKKKFPQEGIIDVMQRNLQRLQTLINQLLDLSKLEAGEMKPNLQEVDLNNFLNQLMASFESLAQSKYIIFNHSQPHTPQFAFFDTDKLEKIVTNLLSNAFKFTPENGRINVRIEYSPLTPDGGTFLSSNKIDFGSKRVPPSGVRGLFLSISDSGIGIAPERLPHIFDRFYQVEEHNNHEGTGIGLALVHELVDLLGGTIEVSSKKSLGTTFNVVLPFTSLEKLSNPVAQFERKINVGESLITGSSKTATPIEADGHSIMLIVEDNPDLRNYIASVFEHQYQLIMAVDGEDGLTKAIEFIPDIVISDLMMPKLDGLGFCEKLKTDERTNHIPVILLTAKASLSDRLEGLEKGADDYLSKPFNKEELQIRVKNLVIQRQKLLEKFSAKTIIEKIEETKEPTIDEIFVQKCHSVIDKYLDRSEFDVEKFADEMKLSSVQLRRKLKAVSNQNVTEFVRNYRLAIAANLLKKSDLSVSEIAYKVGFDSMPYFSKVFQERYGKTASEWKE